jgi:beta-lactamase superfamily II metal-dependent hydrolase
MSRRFLLLFSWLFVFAGSFAYGQANGKLQIHFMDVGQGDGAVLISPGGEVVLFDDGKAGNCDKPVSYLEQLGIKHIDYHVASHYHADHIGCISQVLAEFPLAKDAIDRGYDYRSPEYTAYISAIGSHRKTATPGLTITLDQASPNPVTIEVVAINGNGIKTTNENDLSVVAVVRYGNFRAEFGGDLSGYDTGTYKDIETSVAPKVGHIDVYKVHHHCSRYSTTENWLSATTPQIGIVSAGDGNRYGHPTEECLDSLHHAGVKTYWTEGGNGAEPEAGLDIVGGNIVVEVPSDTKTLTVTYQGTRHDTYQVAAFAAVPPPAGGASAAKEAVYAWSKKATVYHYANCRYVANISPENLDQGPTPPQGKTLHKGCPR